MTLSNLSIQTKLGLAPPPTPTPGPTPTPTPEEPKCTHSPASVPVPVAKGTQQQQRHLSSTIPCPLTTPISSPLKTPPPTHAFVSLAPQRVRAVLLPERFSLADHEMHSDVDY
jgi:protein TonB